MNEPSSSQGFNRLKQVVGWHKLSPTARKIVVSIVGGIALLAGLAMILLPGPAVVVIPLALAILGSQFAWAREISQKFRAIWKRWRKKRA